MLISFLLLYASVRINCINIRNGAKMELNNLSGTIYADTYRSQRETNFNENLSTLPVTSDVALNELPSGKVAISLTVKTLASGLSGKLQPNDIIRIYHFLDVTEQDTTLVAIDSVDIVIRILTPDLKGVNYLKSH